LLEMAATGQYFNEQHKSQSRAVALFNAIKANIEINNALNANRNKVIILMKRAQSTLDGSDAEGVRSSLKRKSSFSLGSPTKINGSDIPTLPVFTLLSDDIIVIEKRLGIV